MNLLDWLLLVLVLAYALSGYWQGFIAGAFATGGLLPDLVVLLMLEPEQGFERTGRGRDYLERAGIEFHRDVARGFLEQAAADPDHWLVLDASRPEMQVTHAILERVRALIS